MDKMLILEDGTCFKGKAFGSLKDAYGEVVFTTAMTGYQELLTDQSFLGQMVVMTYPMIGNYGINRDDYEAVRPILHAFIVRDLCEEPSNFRMNRTLDDYLQKMDVPGLYGIDTRKLTKHIREKGAVKGCIVSSELSHEEAMERLTAYEPFHDHIARCSIKTPFEVPGNGKRVVLLDLGMKQSILKELGAMGFHVNVVPHDTKAEDIMEYNPDGIMLSNGPGDPKDAMGVVEEIRKLLPQVPVFGICMGHQLLSLACGADTRKMKFGHRGGNNPVKDLETGKIMITSQNHGYVVDMKTIEGTGLVVTHKCVNEGSIEGVRHTKYNAFSVQFHPESSPGPTDARRLFLKFKEAMNAGGQKNA
jgi:carbamoyl-phosphate synthase small subunit